MRWGGDLAPKKSIVSHFSAHHSAETTGNSEIEIREEAFSFFTLPDLHKGTDDDTKSDDFLEKFQRGGGVIFNPKIYVADLGTLNRAFCA